MTTRIAARPLAALAAVAIVVAACGSGNATQAPGTGAPATQAPATQAPETTAPVTQAPAETGAEPSFDLSSFHADQKLEDLFPKTIGGETLTVLSMSGDAFMGEGASPELNAALGTLGKSASDLSVAFGGSKSVTIIAFKVAGVPGSTILTALFNAYQQATEATITDVTISGKSAKKITPTDPTEDVTWIYAAQDVVFVVGGTDVTDALLNEVFTKLP